MELVKKIPNSLEAEQGVIASLIIDKEKIREVSELLASDYFYNQINKKIYQAILEVLKKKQDLDLIILKDYLETNGLLEEIGGMEYIVNIVEAIPSSESINVYVKIIYEKYVAREIIEKATSILNKSYTQDDIQGLIEYAEKEIFKISKLTRSEDFLNWNELLSNTYNKIIELANSEKKRLTGLSTGFSYLDNLTSGFQRSDLIILAARPSVGKTALGLNFAKNIAKATVNNNAHVAIFSLEMAAEQLLHRLIASESTVSISKIKNGDLNKEEQELISFGVDNLEKMNIYIDETPGISIGELKSKSRKLKIEKGLDFILIDYLQLITTTFKRDNRQQEVSEISRELKSLAKELNIPIVALSQLSRTVEQRADKKPMMSDIRESGAIEQDADIIMMMYRPEYYQNDSMIENEDEDYEGKTELILTKHRNGATGTLEYKFLKEINKFTQVITTDMDIN